MLASNSAVLPIQTSDRWKEKPHGNRTFFFSANLLLLATLCWLACGTLTIIEVGGGILCVRVSYCCTLNGLLRLRSQGYRPLLLTAHVQESSCKLLFTLRRQHVLLTVLRALMSTKVNVGFFFSYFKYILLYCKIQNHNKAFLFTNVQNLRLYYIFLAINKKIFVQSSLIQYKNMNVSYKLLHFAAAVHWRLPSPFISEVFTWFKSDCGREVSRKRINNHMALFFIVFTLFVYFP